MKAILMSIQPKWVEKIANGEKTIEVRKTAPKIETPFKCFIYMTKSNSKIAISKDNYAQEMKIAKSLVGGCGKIVGEFVCDEIIVDEKGENQDIICENACLTRQELYEYEPRKAVYGWHISDLKIYDKPKELSEFKRWNRTEENAPCAHTKWLYPPCNECNSCNLTRPPQSWCYVEELSIGE